jgi:hypothetical protein
MRSLVRGVVWLLACVLMWCAAETAQAQIFVDDFEVGTVGNTITTIPNGGKWGRIAGTGAPRYAAANNPFPSGAQYADFNNAAGVASRFLTVDLPVGSLAAQLTGHVTTWSFDFLEPSEDGNTGTISFGYTNDDDMNSAKNVWRGNMGNGTLAPNTGNEGGPINYALDAVHTVFMIGNDTASPIANYQGGQTLDPGEADVWISLNGADPVFAFALGQNNPGPVGVGWAAFTGAIEHLFVDNVLIQEGATFNRDNFEPPPRLNLLVDRNNGQVRLENNTDQSMTFSSYEIASDDGSLSLGGWDSIASQNLPGFPVGNGSGNGWEVGPNSGSGELREYFLQGESTLNPGEFISLGQAYNASLDAMDLAFSYVENGDEVVGGPVEYGTISIGSVPGDYNSDGTVDAADYTVWRDRLNANFTLPNENPLAATPGVVDQEDYTFWRNNFGATAGSGGLAQQAVPEPATWLLLVTAGILSVGTACRTQR